MTSWVSITFLPILYFPVIVNVNVPGAVEEVVVTLSVELKVGVPDVGVNDVETPAGAAPDRLRTTTEPCGLPESRFTVTA